jgi:hypothetical protein
MLVTISSLEPVTSKLCLNRYKYTGRAGQMHAKRHSELSREPGAIQFRSRPQFYISSHFSFMVICSILAEHCIEIRLMKPSTRHPDSGFSSIFNTFRCVFRCSSQNKLCNYALMYRLHTKRNQCNVI